MRTGHLISSVFLLIVASALAYFAYWTWVTDATICSGTTVFNPGLVCRDDWVAQIGSLSAGALLYLIGGVVLWKAQEKFWY